MNVVEKFLFKIFDSIEAFNKRFGKKGLIVIGIFIVLGISCAFIYLNRDTIHQEEYDLYIKEEIHSEEVGSVRDEEIISDQEEEKLVQQNSSGKYIGIELVNQYSDVREIQILSKGRALVKKEDSYSIYDETFNEIKSLGDIEIMEDDNGFILYRQQIFQDGYFENAYGVLDCDGNVLLEPLIGKNYDEVKSIYTSFIQSETAEISVYTEIDWESDLVGLKVRGNEEEWILAPVYVDLNLNESTKYAFKNVDGKWGIVNIDGKIILEPNYSNIEYDYGQIEYSDFTDEYPNEPYFIIYNERGEQGVFTLDGYLFEPQIPYENKVQYFHDHVIVQDGTTTTIYNQSGSIVKQFDSNYQFTNVISLGGVETSNSTGYYTACDNFRKCSITDDQFNFVVEDLVSENSYILDNGIFVSISEPNLSNIKQFEFFNEDGSLIERIVVPMSLSTSDVFFGVSQGGEVFVIGNTVYRFVSNPSYDESNQELNSSLVGK